MQCVDPAFEIHSRYARVETAERYQAVLQEYFEKVWEIEGREALEPARAGAAWMLEKDV